MPGLVGTVKTAPDTYSIEEFMKACKCLVHNRRNKIDPVFSDEYIFAARVHNDIIGERTSPVEADGTFCWLDGETYNAAEIALEKYGKALSTGDLLIKADLDGILPAIAKKINGFYNAVLYNANKGTLTFLTDRLGLKHIFLWENEGRISWASELKAFLQLPRFDLVIDHRAVDSFLELGYIIGDFTWFSHVKLIPAATIITFHINSGISKSERYWSWADIKPRRISKEDALTELKYLWRKVIARCWESQRGKIGIALSGGLDSRAILAFSTPNRPQYLFTFGKRGSDDIRIAKKVCHIMSLPHTEFQLGPRNWFKGRVDAIWRVDGRINALHLHGAPFSNHVRNQIDLNLSGFIGDVILGGSYLKNKDVRITRTEAFKKLGNASLYTDPDDPFYNIAHEDPYLIDTRSRCFIIIGTLNNECEQRLPFVDNDIIEFMYSLPDSCRVVSRLSHEMFLDEHPEIFQKVPWQSTGIPISKGKKTLLQTVRLKVHPITTLARRSLQAWGILENTREFTNYTRWLRILFKETDLMSKLLSPNALYLDHVQDTRRLKRLVKSLLASRREIFKTLITDIIMRKQGAVKRFIYILLHGPVDPTEEIMKYSTLEIWLQQLKNKAFSLSMKKTPSRA